MTAEPRTPALTCAVCGEAVDAAMSAECNWCDRRFHLNQRNDVEAKDCGRVWIDAQYMALQFACDDCLREADTAGGGDGAVASAATPLVGGRRRRYRRRA